MKARLEAEQQRAEAASADAQALRQALAEKELLLVAAAPASGDVGEDSVRGTALCLMLSLLGITQRSCHPNPRARMQAGCVSNKPRIPL